MFAMIAWRILETSRLSFDTAGLSSVSSTKKNTMATPADIQYQIDDVHDDRSGEIVVSHAVVLSLVIFAVALRFVSRRLCKTQILADDFMIVGALVNNGSLSPSSLSTKSLQSSCQSILALLGICHWRSDCLLSQYVALVNILVLDGTSS